MKVLSLVLFSSIFGQMAYAGAPPHADVAAMRERIATENLSFSVAESWVTRFLQSGGTLAEITGLLHRVDEDLSGAPHDDLVPDPALPAAFDWREKATGGLTAVRNQGQCGSCWAFSVAGVLESLQKIAHPEADVDVSEQAVVSCSGAGSCGGGYFDAFDYLVNPGLASEAQFPYRAGDMQCKRGLKPVAKLASWSYIGNGRTEPTTDQIKTAIMKYGPVSVDVYAGFGSYNSGIFNDCYAAQTNHMVILVGWNDAGKYWIMRNSWGASWGEDGYMRIKYKDANGYKCNSIGSTAAYAVLDQLPTPFGE